MLSLQITPLEPLSPASFRERLEALPWPEKRHRILRYRQEKDRRLALLAWSLAAAMLQEAGAEDLTLSYAPQGKPFLQQHPDIHFNLSHGGEMAVCAVSDRPVGADIEPLLPYDAEMAAFAFSPEERAWLAEQEDASLAFTRLWVKKESYLKCLGSGLSYPLQELTLIPGAIRQQHGHFIEKQIRNHRLCVCQGESLNLKP